MCWRRVLVAVIVMLAGGPAWASSFTLETSAFLNDGLIPKTDAAAADACGGRNLSPPLHFAGFPPATRSFAVVLFDTDAGHGRGFTHWVAYGIAPTQSTLPPGFGSTASPAFAGGQNDAGTRLYFGPCPPAGDPPHHYVFTVYALDLAPDGLRPGLTRSALVRAIAAHTLAQAEITGTYSRPAP
jgi:Raf kinase inhibitor-like YbhB/YbcL family protein